MAKQISKWTLTERITPNSIHCDRSDTYAKCLTSEKKPRWTLTKRITPNFTHD